jgi:hypothetical protein
MVFVTSDPHGHRSQLVDALRRAGLLDDNENWSGGTSTLWFLGDLLDRGPDGIGVIELVRRLIAQAEAVGGQVGLVLGNHEILALGTYRFARGLIDDDRILSWVLCWQQNGGLVADQRALTDDHVDWLSSRPVMVEHDGHLLMHCDTTAYLEYGSSIEAINAGVTAVLESSDIDAWWTLLERMNARYDFARSGGTTLAESMMHTLGVRRMVHGHSIIGDLMGVERSEVTQALLYARGQVLAIDGGMYGGGPCLVVSLDGWPDRVEEDP